jgi:hypothetical protein
MDVHDSYFGCGDCVRPFPGSHFASARSNPARRFSSRWNSNGRCDVAPEPDTFKFAGCADSQRDAVSCPAHCHTQRNSCSVRNSQRHAVAIAYPNRHARRSRYSECHSNRYSDREHSDGHPVCDCHPDRNHHAITNASCGA